MDLGRLALGAALNQLDYWAVVRLFWRLFLVSAIGSRNTQHGVLEYAGVQDDLAMLLIEHIILQSVMSIVGAL